MYRTVLLTSKPIDMKKIFTAFFISTAILANAQWSNTTNQFYDSLHMPVCTAGNDQGQSIVVRSYPDSGYFVIWEDLRNGGSNFDIYAQKYDKNGVALWATNGLPVATGPDIQRISFWGNADYRNYPHACTDSSGGFYIAWEDFNTVNTGVTNAHRVCAQYIRADGSAAYPGIGLIMAAPTVTDTRQFLVPMLIPDGKKGFFAGFIKDGQFTRDLYIAAYRNNGGLLENYFTDKMDPDVNQGIRNIPVGCVSSQQYFLNFIDDRVAEYYIYPDGYNGCGVIWTFTRNAAPPTGGVFMAYNRLCRVMKDCNTTSSKRAYIANISDPTATGIVTASYVKDRIVKLYNLITYSYTVICLPNTVLMEHIENFGEGYRLLESSVTRPVFDLYYPKGVTLETDGNINVQVITVNLRNFINNQVTDMITQGYFTNPIEKYDSIPYELTSDMLNPFIAYNPTPPVTLNKINRALDTVLDAGNAGFGSAYIFNDYTLTGAGSRAYLAKLSYVPSYSTNGPAVMLQEIKTRRVNADSFATTINTRSKKGIPLGREVLTGFQTSEIRYDNPKVAVDKKGNALFYIREFQRSVRVSPIDDSAKLRWGAMGKPIGNAHGPDLPFVAMGEDGAAVISWQDHRPLISNTGSNIYMRHIDGLENISYVPAPKTIKPLPALASFGFPQLLSGLTNKWSDFDFNTGTNWSTAIQIKDHFNLGVVSTQVYEHNAAIRTHNGKVYLNRNYLVNPQNDPAGTNSVNVRFFFTEEQFETLKTADPSITSPANLVVIKQPGTNNVPSVYAPVAGEQTIVPSSWNAVPGGYYLEIAVNSFSNFFILKGTNALPVTWLNVSARRINDGEATISWQVSNERNVKNYAVEHSTDGSLFTSACTVIANGSNRYACSASAVNGILNYYRVLETDNDGRKDYSRVVILKPTDNNILTLFPNPAGKVVQLQSSESIRAVSIYDMHGRLVFNRQYSAQQTITINTEKLGKGIYTLQAIEQTGVVHTRRLIIQ